MRHIRCSLTARESMFSTITKTNPLSDVKQSVSTIKQERKVHLYGDKYASDSEYALILQNAFRKIELQYPDTTKLMLYSCTLGSKSIAVIENFLCKCFTCQSYIKITRLKLGYWADWCGNATQEFIYLNY